MEELDTLLLQHRCHHVMIVGHLNFHLEPIAFDNLITVQGLANQVTFPMHEQGGLLDPVLSDLHDANTLLGPMGSSHHFNVLLQVKINAVRAGAALHTVWL